MRRDPRWGLILNGNVGLALGKRMVAGKTPTGRLLQSLTLEQLAALERALKQAHKKLPEDLMQQLKQQAARLNGRPR